MGYSTDRQYSDKYIKAISEIIGPLLLEPADFSRDANEATDLMVFTARDIRIAARVRRHGYAKTFPWDFTIRSKRASGAKTELSKIVDGWGDWLFYGHSDSSGLTFDRWMVVDLASFRSHLIRNKQNIRYVQKHNDDGQTSLVAFDVRSFVGNPPILVASSHPIEFEKEAA